MTTHARLIGILGALLAIGAMAPLTVSAAGPVHANYDSTPGGTTPAFRPVAIDVLANDTPGVASASRPLTISKVTQGAHGAVTTDGRSVVYNPSGCYVGLDQFSYTVTDGVTSDVGQVIFTVARPAASPTTDVPTASFVNGRTIGSTVPLLVRWCGVATGGASVSGYRLAESTNGGASWSVAFSGTSTAAYRNVRPSTNTLWEVRTTDTTRGTGAYTKSLLSRVASWQDTSTRMVYSSGWRTATTSRYSGHKAHYIAKTGATATLTVSNVRQFAIVASRGKGRGSFYVYVDGRRVTSAISQRSSSAAFRRILYVGSIPGNTAGLHTLQVRTANGSRVDLDTILTLSGRGTSVAAFAAPTPSAVYGDTGYKPKAASTSGLPTTVTVAQASWSVCALAAGTVTYHGTGTCTLLATQPADPSWNAASASQAISVGRAPLTVTGISAVNRTYDGTTGATLTKTSPDVIGRRLGDGPAAVALNASAATGSFADANAGASKRVTVAGLALTGTKSAFYSLVPPAPSATIAKRTLTITARPASRLYGAADPVFTFTATGFVAGQTSAVIDTPPACVVIGTHTQVGGYPIRCSGGADNNYAFTYVDSTLSVTPRTVTVRASSPATVVFGAGTPALTPSYAGFVAPDTASVLTSAPTCGTTYTPGKAVGSYPTTCSGAAATNYAFTYVAGSLVVAKATPTVSVNGGTSTVDGDPHGATGFAFGVGGIADVLSPAITLRYAGTGGTVYGPTSVAPSAVGTYVATGSFAGNGNYLAATGTAAVIISDKLTQAIVFDPLGDLTYGADPFSVSADGGASGNPVVFASRTTSVCTVSGTTVMIVAAGPCTIRATQAGSALYAAADPVDRTFTVEKKALVITASSPAAIPYGDAAPAVIPGYAGFVGSDGPADLSTPPSCGTPYTPGDAPGPYGTGCAGAVAANYQVSYVSGSFTVNPKVLPVTFSAEDRVYDATTAATVTGCSVTGSVGTDDVTCAFGSAIAAFATAGAGTDKTVTASGFGLAGSAAGRYVLGSVTPATASITRASPNCTVTGYTVTYDGSPHTAAGACLGVVGEALAAPGLAGTTHTNAGTYPTDPWTFTDVSGNYTNDSGTVVDTIDAGSQTITFDEAAPAGATVGGSWNPTATSSSLLPVAITVHDSTTNSACSIAAGTVHYDAVGTCVLAADQPGDGNWSPAPQVLLSFPISGLLAQSITFTGPGGTVYGASVALAATATSGLPVAFESVTPGVCTVTGDTATAIATGPCTVRATQGGNATYDPAPDEDRSFNVDPRPIEVTAQPDSRVADGTTGSSSTPILTSGSLAPGDTSAFIQAFETPEAGTSKPIVPSGTVVHGLSDVTTSYAITWINDTTGVITPAAASLATSTITASQTTLTGDGSTTSDITVVLRDAYGNALTASGGIVTLGVTGPGAVGTVTDNADGTYSAIYTSAVVGAPATAEITGALDAQAMADEATITLTP